MAEMTPHIAAMTVFCNERFRVKAWKEFYNDYRKSLDLHVIINNGDKKDTEFLKSEFPDSVVLECKKPNLLSAYNIGLDYILHDKKINAIMQITNDIKFESGAIEKMLDYLLNNESVGVVGPVICKRDSNIIESSGWVLSKFFGGGKPLFRSIDYNDLSANGPQQVTFIPAGAIMVRRSAWEKIGHQDEALYMYQDERDFSINLKKKGYSEIVLFNSRAWHQHQNAPGKKTRPLSSIYYSIRNRIYVTKKHYGRWMALLEFCYLVFYTLILMIKHIICCQIKYLKCDQTALKGLFDGIRGKMNKIPPSNN